MPIKRLRLTKTEQDEYTTGCLQLEKLGIVTGAAGHPRSQAKRFTLQQIDPEFARVYDLPAGDVAVVVPAKLTVPKAGVLFTDAQMLTPWDDSDLALSDPEEHRSFDDLIEGLPLWPTQILNHLLIGHTVPLRPCQLEGGVLSVRVRSY